MVWSLPTVLLTFCILIGSPGCALFPDGPETYEGSYEYGFEVNSFKPCGTGEQWWVTGNSTELREQYMEIVAEEYKPVFVRLSGEAGPKGSFGHMGAYDREFELESVKEVREKRPNDCD